MPSMYIDLSNTEHSWRAMHLKTGAPRHPFDTTVVWGVCSRADDAQFNNLAARLLRHGLAVLNEGLDV